MAVASHEHRTPSLLPNPSTNNDQSSNNQHPRHPDHGQFDQHHHHLHPQPHFLLTSVPGSEHTISHQSHSLAIPRTAHEHPLHFSSPIDGDTLGGFDGLPQSHSPLEPPPELMNPIHGHRQQQWPTSSQGQQQQHHHFGDSRGLDHLYSHHGHQRDSSLSTLGSAGPSSPFAHSTSNPHIALADSAHDDFSEHHDSSMAAIFGTQPKHHPVHSGEEHFYGHLPVPIGHTATTGAENTGKIVHSTEPTHHDTSFMAGHSLSAAFHPSNPVSVASSIASDSPATPCLDEGRKLALHPTTVPKLEDHHDHHDHNMTDVFPDDIYNPNFTFTTTASATATIPVVAPSTPVTTVSPSSDIFSQRLHAANTQHLSAAHSPATKIPRDRSPFRHGSPLAPISHDINAPRMPSAHQPMRFQSSQQLRERQKAEQDAAAMLQHQRMTSQQPETGTVKTISPEDAMLDFPDPTGDSAHFSLFPEHDNSHHFMGLGDSSVVAHTTTQAFGSVPVTAHDAAPFSSYVPATLSQQYSFLKREHEEPQQQQQQPPQPQQRQQQQQPSHSQVQTFAGTQKPSPTTINRGTFSCTYQNCPMRFETAALLQKHKREDHRQVHGLGSARRADVSVAPGAANSQSGPHRCTQINPSTGKPCNTEFSRPYDLTRHEDTIHNPKKKKVTCPACTDKKQFSRGDALSRHYRVCHPELPVPGKRRGGAGRG